MRVVVTGGSGKAGRAVTRDLVEHGYKVTNVDRVTDADPVCSYRQANLDELGQAVETIAGCDAVVHLAAIPRPYLATDEATFRTNVASTFNVFSAACMLGVARVVWASSETTMGLPFDDAKPYFPIDEGQATIAKSTYALSKVLGEEMARYFSSQFGVPFVGLRISNVFDDDDYRRVPGFQADARMRSFNAWSYVDRRDVAQACRRGLETSTEGADVFIIAAADTVMSRTNADLIAEVFPNVPLRAAVGEHETLQSIDKARRVLGYEPVHTWRV